MKYLRSFLLFLSAAFIISSCQKELSFEEGAARGSLKKVSGDCMPATIAGSYKKDTLLTAANYVDIQVDITQTGTYAIKTDTLNGYSFSATGVVAVEGINTIRLLASGRPVAAALDTFRVKFDSTSCVLNIVVTGTGGGGATAAKFTLVGSPSFCTGAKQSNNFYATIPTNSANRDTVFVNVSQAGTYTINTGVAVNGLQFSASGTLAVGNNIPIILQATGTPAAMSSNTFPLNTSSPNTVSNCGFTIITQAAPPVATYTFECPSNPTFFGTYQAGVSTAGDSIKINVTSIAGGSYTITTNTTVNSNGVTYGGSGVLAASPNPQSVTLLVLGTPTVAGPFTYTLTGTGVSSTCTFDQTYSAAPVANGTITVKINGAATASTFNINAEGLLTSSGGVSSLVISGDSSIASNSPIVTLSVDKNGTIGSGTYTSASFTNAATAQYDDSAGTMFIGWIGGGSCTITITSITIVAPLRVQGTFSGVLKDNVGMGTNTTTFASGTFDVPYQ